MIISLTQVTLIVELDAPEVRVAHVAGSKSDVQVVRACLGDQSCSLFAADLDRIGDVRIDELERIFGAATYQKNSFKNKSF